MNDKLKELQGKREAMELRAKELKDYLCGPGQPGLKGGLDDAEGYPRGDIDIIKIVEARHELACLNTDYSALMKEIETELLGVHSKSAVAVPRGPSTYKPEKPFAVVSQIAPNSPGEKAGLKDGDLIIEMGPLNLITGGTLQDIFKSLPSLVQSNKVVKCHIKRGKNEFLDLHLKPSEWEGPGLLGFRLEPFIP